MSFPTLPGPSGWLGEVSRAFETMIPESGDNWGNLVDSAFLILKIDPLVLARAFHVDLKEVEGWRQGHYVFFERRIQILRWFQKRIRVLAQEETNARYRGEDALPLYNADPSCCHNIVAAWSGVRCTGCSSWYCAG